MVIIQRIQHLEPADLCSRLEFWRWINSKPQRICNNLFTDEAHFTRDGVNNTRNSHLCNCDNPHGTVESNHQHLFAVNVWCHWWPTHKSVDFTATSDRWYLCQLLANELPALLENVPLQTWRHMCYQHDEALPHFSQVIRQCLNHRFPNQWIGHGSSA